MSDKTLRDAAQMALNALTGWMDQADTVAAYDEAMHRAVDAVFALRAALAAEQPEQREAVRPVDMRGMAILLESILSMAESGTGDVQESLRAAIKIAQQPAVPERPCAGIGDSSCNYLASCGSVCNKCGRVHDGERTPWARAQQTAVPLKVRWAQADMSGGDSWADMREKIRKHPLHDIGDTILVWVNEGDIHMLGERVTTKESGDGR